jgi:hypothetical protein
LASLWLTWLQYRLLKRKHCPFCRLLGVLYEDGIGYLGHNGEAQTNYGAFHLQGFIEGAYQELGEWLSPSLSHEFGSFPCSTSTEQIELFLTRNTQLWGSTKPFLMLSHELLEDEHACFGPITPLEQRPWTEPLDNTGYHVDIKILSSMINICNITHTECSDRKDSMFGGKRGDNQRMLLIDIEDMCLVKAGRRKSGLSEEYVTLSYVWGSNSMSKTTTENIQFRKTKGGLADLEASCTFRDCVAVLSGLGLRCVYSYYYFDKCGWHEKLGIKL